VAGRTGQVPIPVIDLIGYLHRVQWYCVEYSDGV